MQKLWRVRRTLFPALLQLWLLTISSGPVGAIILSLTTDAGLSIQRVFSFKFPLNSCLDYSET